MALFRQTNRISWPSIPSLYLQRRSFLSRRFSTIRFSLPFPSEKARHFKEIEAAVNVVEKACRLCVDVKKSLISSQGRILEKKDNTPVTVADFGVQALISLELGKLFPSIPLVAEEDSEFLRSISKISVVDYVIRSVVDQLSDSDETNSLSRNDLLEAIDRGGENAFTYNEKPATYWVLDPIDGTRGFLKGDDALYVVGLSLVIKGKLALGVMGCPNWKENHDTGGTIMAAHVGCGTWKRKISFFPHDVDLNWSRCFVDNCQSLQEAKFCIPESQTWESLPISTVFTSTINATESIRKGDSNRVLLWQICCGSLCKYMIVAAGRATIFMQQEKKTRHIKVWDHASGIICVQEAGGKITDWEGNELDLSIDELKRRIILPSGGVLVSNNFLHKSMLEILQH
ncbi:putative PAP-specific phosphatase, mitochondrial [Zostera marina]|uniref:Putative PAP-specific phosphatase, mitochondrial n=1 Tax=Zostera marina TaxID=29655 RepID=A0A0K9P1D4_ZOSMR|nr:putative PAP-specific phosphatase, mitochondrial [Zostera marina]